MSGLPTHVTKSPHILHFSPLAAIGGCEVNCLRVIEGLPTYEHRVVVFNGRGPMSEKWEVAGAQVEHLGAWRTGNRGFKTRLTEWARNCDEPAGVFYWSTSRLPAILKTMAHWDAPWAVYLGNPAAGNLIRRTQLLVQEYTGGSKPNVTLVACSGHVAASHRVARYFRKFPIETIYNAVGPAFDQPREYRALPRGSMPRVGMVARLDAIKDHLTLLRALAATRSTRDDVVLEFAGDGNLLEFLVQQASHLGVRAQVRFLGSVTDVAALIAGWDVYVHSTTAAEGMGTAVAEAMMAGMPCVVSDIAVMREVCGHEGAAYVQPANPAAWGQALLRLFADHNRRVALGSAAQKRARRLFALPEVAERYLKIISPNAMRAFA